MKTVRVSERDQLVIGLNMYPPGAVIDLDDARAADLLGKEMVVEVGPEVSERYPIQPHSAAPLIGPAQGGAAIRPAPQPSPEVRGPDGGPDAPKPGPSATH